MRRAVWTVWLLAGACDASSGPVPARRSPRGAVHTATAAGRVERLRGGQAAEPDSVQTATAGSNFEPDAVDELRTEIEGRYRELVFGLDPSVDPHALAVSCSQGLFNGVGEDQVTEP